MTSTPLDHAGASSPRTPLIPRWTIWLVAILCLLAIASVYYGRVVIGPSDLYRKDQGKTMAYTVDMVVNHRFSLPRDPIFQPATKPPLYNWVAAVGVGLTRQYGEWAQKWPSIASALVISGLLFQFCRRRFVLSDGQQVALLLALFAAAIWICTKSTVLLVYIARPDMVQALCLVGGWLAANNVIEAATKRDARIWAAAFWIATTAAALAKGPAAVYPMLYALLAPGLIFGNWRKIAHFHWLWGLIGLFATVGVWLLCAYLQDSKHVTGVLLGTEVFQRIASANPEGRTKPRTEALKWWYSQNQYWSHLAIGAMLVGLLGSLRQLLIRRGVIDAERGGMLKKGFDLLRIRDGDGFFTGPAGMATLWVIVVVGCLSVPADQRQDFLLPAHPASAVLAASFLIYVVTRFEWTRYALPLAAALVMLREKRLVTDTHVLIVAGLYLVIAAGVLMVRKTSPRALPVIAWSVVVAFVGFEVMSSRLGTHIIVNVLGIVWLPSFKLSPTMTLITFFAGGGLSAALVVFAHPRWRWELPFIAAGIIFWGYALLQNNYKATGLPGSTNPSLYATRFATDAKEIVGDDKVVSIFRSKNPILTLMGRHQGSYLTRKDFEEAQWVIVERSKFPALQDTEQEKLYSGKIDVEYGHITDMKHYIMKDRVALIRIDKERNVPSVDDMLAIHLWVQDWTTEDANPYRSPDTGWIDVPGEPRPRQWTPPQGDPWFGRGRSSTKPVDTGADEDEE